MHTKVTATITIDIDLDSFSPDISVDIQAEDGLPNEMIKAAVIGGCKATINTLETSKTLPVTREEPANAEG